jgi:polyhydroxyalkanoate synthesis regulator phasin
MADEKPKKAAASKSKKAKAKPKKAAAAKTKKAAKAKPNPDKKQTAKKSGAGKKSTATKAKAAPSKSKTATLDKSISQLKDSLEHSVTLSRDRIQEVVDDAVKRGRMTHGDAEKMIGELLKRGRKQTDALLSELEKLVRQARRKLP